MKKYFYYSLLIFILNSCETQFSNTFIIKNNSNHKLTIIGFDKIVTNSTLSDTSVYKEEIVINKFDEYKVIKSAGYHSENQGIFKSSQIDSLVIIFDNLKKISFSCQKPVINYCSGKYNIINYKENYVSTKTGKSSGKDEYTYSFTFDESDYISADSIIND